MQGSVFLRLFDRLASVPHRSVTSLPYGEWFSLYVHALKAARQEEAAALRDKEDLHVARRALDAALLSSVVSQRWTDVVLPSNSNNNNDGTMEASWWHESTAAEWLRPSRVATNNDVATELELVTTSFLVEPLLAGRAIASWTAAVRDGSAASPTTDAEEDKTKHRELPTESKGIIVIPFTTLFQLRYEAHLRPPSSLTGEEKKKQLQTSLSLQERSARLSVLQSLHHLMELQSSSKRKSSQLEVVVLSPINEFDAIMQVSRIHAGLPDSLKKFFSLTHVCEQEMVRAAYLSHYLTFATKGAPLVVLSPQSQYAKLQMFGVSNCCIKSQLAHEEKGKHQISRNSNHVSLHQQAVKRCGKLVRRMSTREENMRHILVP